MGARSVLGARSVQLPGRPRRWIELTRRIAERVRRSTLAAVRAAGLGHLVTPSVLDAWEARFERLQRRLATGEPPANPPRALFGFNIGTDRKVQNTDALLNALVSSPDLDVDRVKTLVARGPTERGWQYELRQDDALEVLVAALVDHLVHGQGKSLQLNLGGNAEELFTRVTNRLHADGAARDVVGCAAAFCGVAAAAGGLAQVSFHTYPPASGQQLSLLPGRVTVVTPGSFDSTTEGLVDDRTPPSSGATATLKINPVLQYTVGPFTFDGADYLTVRGTSTKLRASSTGRIIFGTGNGHHPAARKTEPIVLTEPSFDPALTDRQLERLAQSHDLLFLGGIHYLTRHSGDPLEQKLALLVRQLDTLRQANPKLVTHVEYVVPKNGAVEAQVMRALIGHMDSIALNASELSQLLGRLSPSWASQPPLDHHDPRSVYEAAVALAEVLVIERVRLHADRFDLVVVRDGDDGRMRAEVDAALIGRRGSVNKIANPSGVISTAEESWPALPAFHVPSWTAMVDLFRYLSGGRGSAAATLRAQLRQGYSVRPGGRRYSVAINPTRYAHATDGGFVSAGDTLDGLGYVELFQQLYPRGRPPSTP